MSYQACQPRTESSVSATAAVGLDADGAGFSVEGGSAYGNAAAMADLGLSSAPDGAGAPIEGLPVDPTGGPVPPWAARCRGVTSVYAYSQFQALQMAWSSWGERPGAH